MKKNSSSLIVNTICILLNWISYYTIRQVIPSTWRKQFLFLENQIQSTCAERLWDGGSSGWEDPVQTKYGGRGGLSVFWSLPLLPEHLQNTAAVPLSKAPNLQMLTRGPFDELASYWAVYPNAAGVDSINLLLTPKVESG